MPKNIRLLFVILAVTFTGSAVSSLATFLSIESHFQSFVYLSLALALKTGSAFVLGANMPRIVSHWGPYRACFLSQLLGLVALGFLYYGFSQNSIFSVLSGIVLSGLPMGIIRIVLNSEIRMQIPEEDLFRKVSALKESVMGILFLLTALLIPFLLLSFDIKQLIIFDGVSYLIAFVLFFRLSVKEKYTPPAQPYKLKAIDLFKRRSVLQYVLYAGPILLLGGALPLLASSNEINFSNQLPDIARHALWAFEAASILIASIFYIRLRSKISGSRLKYLLAMNGVFLAFTLWAPSHTVVMASLFMMALFMFFGLQAAQDDLLLACKDDGELTYRFSSLIGVLRNLGLALSPLILGSIFKSFTGQQAVYIILGFQGACLALLFILISKRKASDVVLAK
ncbi:MAG: hypothetical protein R2827_00985 [Bdellovibrionales bacterium]